MDMLNNPRVTPILQLLGGWAYPSEKYEFANGKDDIPYMQWKIKNGPNHQPDNRFSRNFLFFGGYKIKSS